MAKRTMDESESTAAADGPGTQTEPQPTQYQYVGSVVSTQRVAGREVTLAPGTIVTLDAADRVTVRLLAQKLLAPYTVQ